MCNAPDPPPPDAATFARWLEYEKIAMHFNDLLIRFRLQAVGGLAAVGAIAGVMVSDKGSTQSRYQVAAVTFALLAIAWVALAALDIFYYRLLLRGAVETIRSLEETFPPGYRMSKTIDRFADRGSKWCPPAFYVLILIGLILGCGWSRANAPPAAADTVTQQQGSRDGSAPPSAVP
jgi:hypothetical protein